MGLVDLAFAPIRLVMDHTYLALVPAALLALGYARHRSTGRGRLLLVAALVWIGYAAYETRMYYWSKTVTAPIRVDLLLITPLLYALTLWAAARWVELARRG